MDFIVISILKFVMIFDVESLKLLCVQIYVLGFLLVVLSCRKAFSTPRL